MLARFANQTASYFMLITLSDCEISLTGGWSIKECNFFLLGQQHG